MHNFNAAFVVDAYDDDDGNVVNDYYLPPRSAWSRVPSHSTKNNRGNSRWKIGSAVLIIAALLVFIAVVAIGGLALWMGAMRTDTKNPMMVFACSFRIARGEKYNPMLKLNTSMVFREKERKRKIPRTVTNLEDTIQDIIAKETYSTSSLFKDMELDLTTIQIRRMNAEINTAKNQKPVSQQRNTMITKNGLLRPNRNNTLMTNTKAKSKPSKIEANEDDIDFDNIPTIQGTYQATKLNNTRGMQKTEAKVSSGIVELQKESTTEKVTKSKIPSERITDIKSTTKLDFTITASTDNADKYSTSTATAIVSSQSTNKLHSTNPSTEPTSLTPSTEAFEPFKKFPNPEYEESPWRPIIPSYTNTEIKQMIPGAESVTSMSSTYPPENEFNIKYGTVGSPIMDSINIEDISLTSPLPFDDVKFSLPSINLNPVDTMESNFPNDRIVPQEMVNFRPNGKFKNKIPGIDDTLPLKIDETEEPEIEVSGYLPKETFSVHVGASAGSEIPLGFTPLPISEFPNPSNEVKNNNSATPIIPQDKTDAIPLLFDDEEIPPMKISGIGVAEPVVDLELDLESRNKFTDIAALDPDDDKTLIDKKIDQQFVPPVYTSYRTPDLNGGAKPSLVENHGTSKPFRHTIPVDKLNPTIFEDTTIKPNSFDTLKNENKSEKNTANSEIYSNIENFDSITPITAIKSNKTIIDDGEILQLTTTEIYSEVLHPSYNNGEKLVVDPDSNVQNFTSSSSSSSSSMSSLRNSTFIQVNTLIPTPETNSEKNPELFIWTWTNETNTEASKKTYNDTLNANIVRDTVTSAPSRSSTVINRPIRTRPQNDMEKFVRVENETLDNDKVNVTNAELLKNLFGNRDLTRSSSNIYETIINNNKNDNNNNNNNNNNNSENRNTPIKSIIEVVTSISTKVSTKVRTNNVVLSFDITNSTSLPIMHDESRDRTINNDESPGETRTFNNQIDRATLQAFDRRISTPEERKELLEKLKQFAEVRTDGDNFSSSINKKNISFQIGSGIITKADEEMSRSPVNIINVEELKKLADVAAGNKTSIIANGIKGITLSRDGIEVLTKILNKAEDRLDKMISTTTDESKVIITTADNCNGFQCNDGKCLPSGGRCNMLGECSNSEDEANCTCADFLRAQLLEQKICDGVADCWDYSDESNCDWCLEGQFVCGSSRFCVDQKKVCDGYRDCPSGEDEKKCAALIEDDAGLEFHINVNKDKEKNFNSHIKNIFQTHNDEEENVKYLKTQFKASGDDQDALETLVMETTTFRIVTADITSAIDTEKISEKNYPSKLISHESIKNPKVVGREITSSSKNELSQSSKNSFHVNPGLGIPLENPNTRNEINSYSDRGFLSVRKNGKWGKLCLSGMNSLLEERRAIWTIEDLGRAVCKAITYQDYENVEKVRDDKIESSQMYYSLFFNDNAPDKASLTFKTSSCPSKEVLRVKCKNLECGIRTQTTSQARIVGGGSSTAGSWPWQVALYKEGDYQCGGALISDKYILSAAHCFYHAQNEYWVARIGATRRGNFPTPHEQIITLENIALHPDYIDNGFINDIALLRLEQPVTFSDYVRPICLPDTEPKSGTTCTVTGWGQLFEIGRIFPDTLQEVDLPLISTEECRRKTLFLPLYRITSGMLCAGLKDGGRDACMGDSGGPLVCRGSDNRYTLHGITSNGYGCARPGRPGVYTKVHHYIRWIDNLISKHNDVVSSIPICKGHRCPLGECLPKSRVCNGFLECSDGSDERDCISGLR
ncbi:hypothetical protein PV326_005954 [Microctonus aethiopoides]|nr:hypothetical protein PV326_005954 [Microctonus aethiopoides]